jgi:cysteine desulfurase/selenocysteine lyase
MAANVMHKPQAQAYDVQRIRRDFPILARLVNGKPLVYLDSAASSQRPLQVIEAVDRYEKNSHANVHRGVHALSQEATEAFEGARDRVRRFINAGSTREVLFTRGTTEGINLVAQSYARSRFGKGDEILITALEHHANIVPWQLVCEQTGATLKVAPIDKRGEVRFEEFTNLLSPRTKLVAIAHVSNALGTILPVKRMIDAAHAHGAVVLVDGAQAVPHATVDVRALDADFYVFSAHKLYGPTGIGVLYGRESLLDAMPPWQGGGDMIKSVSFERTTYNDLPWKFEAGTSAYVDAIGLGAAVDYLQAVGMDKIHEHEQALVAYALPKLQALDGVRVFGPTTLEDRVGVISFDVAGIHPHDVAQIFDSQGICVRAGHHCNQPLMTRLGTAATTRASFYLYNTFGEIDALIAAVGEAKRVFKV